MLSRSWKNSEFGGRDGGRSPWTKGEAALYSKNTFRLVIFLFQVFANKPRSNSFTEPPVQSSPRPSDPTCGQLRRSGRHLLVATPCHVRPLGCWNSLRRANSLCLIAALPASFQWPKGSLPTRKRAQLARRRSWRRLKGPLLSESANFYRHPS